MAVRGIGIDIVMVERLVATLERFGKRFEARPFTDAFVMSLMSAGISWPANLPPCFIAASATCAKVSGPTRPFATV